MNEDQLESLVAGILLAALLIRDGPSFVDKPEGGEKAVDRCLLLADMLVSGGHGE